MCVGNGRVGLIVTVVAAATAFYCICPLVHMSQNCLFQLLVVFHGCGKTKLLLPELTLTGVVRA